MNSKVHSSQWREARVGVRVEQQRKNNKNNKNNADQRLMTMLTFQLAPFSFSSFFQHLVSKTLCMKPKDVD